MIQVKVLKDGYSIEYDNDGFIHNFSLMKDGELIKRDESQRLLEDYWKDYVERISKADNKFKPPIKAFGFGWQDELKTGVITSANIIDNSFWFTQDGTKQYGRHSKEQLGSDYYAFTKNNETHLVTLNELRATIRKSEKEIIHLHSILECRIDKTFIEAKQSDKKA